MGENEKLPGSVDVQNVDLLGDAVVNEHDAQLISDRVLELISKGFAHHPRVIAEHSGGLEHRSLRLLPDLDPGLFVDELKGKNLVDVDLSYSLEGNAADAKSTVSLVWHDPNGHYTESIFREGQQPEVETYEVTLDDQPRNVLSVPFTAAHALELQGVMNGVRSALDDQKGVIAEPVGSQD